jgi:chorismate dehydratase
MEKITGLPFVFAAWISTRPLPQAFLNLFNEANAIGLARIDELVAAENFELYDLQKYYRSQISYTLDERKQQGMNLFLEYLKEPVIL